MKRIAVLLLVATALMPGRAPATSGTRLSLLAAETGYSYWSSDAQDPEADRVDVTRHCSFPPVYGTAYSEPCLSGAQASGFIHTLFFLPAALLATPVTTAGRFHVELAVDPAPMTVHFVVQSGVDQWESPAATLVSPGVFEGAMPAFTLVPARGNLLGLRIRTASPAVTVTLATRGRSYLETDVPVAISSTSQLLSQSTYAPAPSVYETPQRSFWFNDAAWSVQTFQGDLGAVRTFPIHLEEDASVVYSWVEMYDAPLIHDAARSRSVDSRRITNAVVIKVFRDETQLDRGPNFTSMHGRGMESVALVDVAAGDLTVQVTPATSSMNAPYALHVLVTTRDRTLARMRWRFSLVDDEPLIPHRSITIGYCPAASEPVPVTSTVTTYSASLRWDSVNPMEERWTWRFFLPDVGAYQCGEAGVGPSVRFTVPGARVDGLGATPARNTMFVSERMTLFEADVRFAHTPA